MKNKRKSKNKAKKPRKKKEKTNNNDEVNLLGEIAFHQLPRSLNKAYKKFKKKQEIKKIKQIKIEDREELKIISQEKKRTRIKNRRN